MFLSLSVLYRSRQQKLPESLDSEVIYRYA